MRVPFTNIEITRRAAAVPLSVVPRDNSQEFMQHFEKALQAVFSQSSSTNVWWPVREPYTGAWQENVELDAGPTLLAFSAVFCCITGIASDIGKLRAKLSRIDANNVWREIAEPSPFKKVLQKPNHYQNHIKFKEQWIVSKLTEGNAYVLKSRDARGIVNAMYVLDPKRVTPLVAENGDVYYELRTEYLSRNGDKLTAVTVPASEIIHDTMVCLFHPLIGVSPLYACALSATMGNRIQTQSANLFANSARPGGVLTAPGKINDDVAARLKAAFEANFSGTNVGRIAVLGDGLKFEPMVLSPEVLQLVEQLKWTVQDVGRCFHYPMFKLGGDLPAYAAAPDVLTTMYYTDCLQNLIESMELCLDEGLALPADMGTELDTDNLLRMDTGALYDSNNKAKGWMKLDEQRARANLPPLPKGGNTVYMQQQDYSVEALAKRDALDDPFNPKREPAALPPATEEPEEPDTEKGWDSEVLDAYAQAAMRYELTRQG